MVYMYHSFLIHSSADGHLGCFHVLAMINSAAMNTGVHVSLSDLVSLLCILHDLSDQPLISFAKYPLDPHPPPLGALCGGSPITGCPGSRRSALGWRWPLTSDGRKRPSSLTTSPRHSRSARGAFWCFSLATGPGDPSAPRTPLQPSRVPPSLRPAQ